MSPDAPTPDVQPTTDVPLLAGRYRLHDKLGQGGMGAVFRGHDAKLDRPIAVKLLPSGSVTDAQAVARFRREARALARLSHPGIIQAYDSGEDGDKHFLVMELVEGHTLAKELADRGRIPPTRAADYAYQAALALHHAHQSGLVHRDVKPSNLLLSADGKVKLLDLGLARFLQDQLSDGALTRAGYGMGTPDYCPPEQCRDAHKADPRSDVYSLGCTLYHCIAGRVPFTGSSMSEKMQAHETAEPAALEESCPDMPAGLALVVRRMTAKRPQDRFQTMAEVAEALAPYVATSSPSFRDIRNTATWDGSRLATMPSYPRRRRALALAVASAAAALALTAVGLIGLAAGWFRPAAPQVAQNQGPEPAPADLVGAPPVDPGPAKAPDQPPPKVEEPIKEPPDPNVLTVAQKPGAAQYQTITAALEAVKPGQTIRVLDDAVYRETLTFNRTRLHAGVTLEAARGATLERDTGGGVVLYFLGVPHVSVRGFRLRAKKAERADLIGIQGDCPGLRLESLDLSSDGEPTTNGIEILGNDAGADREPIVIQGCTFRGLGIAALFGGGPAEQVAGVALRDGLFVDCFIGAKIIGQAARVQLVGNRFSGLRMAAMQFESLTVDSEDILIANNSFSDCAGAFRLWDSKVKGKGVRLQNNLLLAGQSPDMYFLEADNPQTLRGPGNGAAVAKAYDFGHNWREGRQPTGANAKSWIPPDPKKGDVFQQTIDGVNRDSKSPDFLRPDKDSPLVTAGAGNEDPSLPRYVGALPPEGADPWDWDRAWRMPKDAQLLTVSKEEKGGGKYRTINDALKEAKPWATIRVLDAETYKETIALDQKERHTGVSLEAPKRATILLAGNSRQALVVRGVPRVRVSDFVIRQEEGTKDNVLRVLVQISGECPGLTLESLELRPVFKTTAVILQDFTGSTDAPVCIARCRIDGGNQTDGIVASGPAQASSTPSRGLALRDNHIKGVLRGVHLHGSLADIQVAGNQVIDCLQEGIGIEDLATNAARILIVNNTLFNCEAGVRGWLNPSADLHPGQVEILGNLSLENVAGDMLIVVNPDNVNSTPSEPKGRLAATVWRFGGNWRDLLGMGPVIPLAPGDHKLDGSARLPRDSSRADFLRPQSDSPLAAKGAGKTDPSLPSYVGAVPPEGAAWDWDRTWRARVKKVEDEK